MKSSHYLLSASLAALLFGAAASAQQPIAQQPSALPPDATQPPAPIIRPRPVVPPPRQSATGASGSTGQATVVHPHRAITTDATTGAGAPQTPKPKPASKPTTRPSATPPAALVPSRPAGTASVPFSRTTIVLDPSHGGVDGGSRISDSLQEKDVDLAFANRLRSLLQARGFNVQLTRDNDSAAPADAATPLKLDDRAGIANHLHPVACLLLHATGSGKGVHLYSSELAPVPLQPALVPWLTAQASWVNSSRALQKQLGIAIGRAEVPLVLSRASIRPLDSLTCPALVLELAPNTGDKESVSDAGYQQKVATAIASAMIFWQNQAQPPDRVVPIPVVHTETQAPAEPLPNVPPGLQP